MQSLISIPAPALLSIEGAVGIVFILTLMLVIAGAMAAILSRALVRSVAGLAVCFTGVAGLYYFLLSPFLAMMQMLIYVGAVSILIVFGIMMVTQTGKDTPVRRRRATLAGPVGFSVGMLLFAAFTLFALKTDWYQFSRSNQGGTRELGLALLSEYVLAFEVISVVLLLSIIGALVLAQRGRG